MPTYVYACAAGHELECEQRITDKPHTTCRELIHNREGSRVRTTCSAPCRRLIGPTSFALKGKGWGKDGYSK